jgi:hypothetical protein
MSFEDVVTPNSSPLLRLREYTTLEIFDDSPAPPSFLETLRETTERAAPLEILSTSRRPPETRLQWPPASPGERGVSACKAGAIVLNEELNDGGLGDCRFLIWIGGLTVRVLAGGC